MRPLLWKEMRDRRTGAMAAAAVLLVVPLLCRNQHFAAGFLTMYVFTLPTLAVIAAALLGASQVARERASKTLDFLLARPIAPGSIVWTKFLAGTAALALLVPAMAALFYAAPEYRGDTSVMALRQGVAWPQLVLALFPRAWCVYAFALVCSVLVDRMAKGLAAIFVSALAVGSLAMVYAELVPFSGIEARLPFLDPSVLFRLAQDPGLMAWTGLTLSAVALLLAMAASLLFGRSPARVLSDKELILGCAALIGMAFLCGSIEPNRLPLLEPAGTLELHMESKHDVAAMDAGGKLVRVAAEDSLAFLDFADPARPRKVAETAMPLWTTKELTVSGNETYILGTKKALPTDERQVAIARLSPEGQVQFAEPVPLGAEDAIDFTGTVAIAGHYLYFDAIRRRQCRIEAYDLAPGASRSAPAAALVVDTVREPPPGTPERQINPGFMRMLLHGRFLYVASPEALTTIDIGDPGRPVVTSRIAFRPFIPVYYGGFRDLASDGRWLLHSEVLLPWSLYDLADPAHPALRGHAGYNDWGIVDNGPSLYLRWRRGVLEFRAANGGLEARRYLTDGRRAGASMLAAADGYVYTLKHLEEKRYVSAYRVTP